MNNTIFNTTILKSGFYIQLQHDPETHASAKLRSEDIFGTWRFIYNLAIDDLIAKDILDIFGRVRIPQDRLCEAIKEAYHFDSENDWEISHTLCNGVLWSADSVLPEWTKVYPKALLSLPLYQIGQDLSISAKTKFSYQRLCSDDVVIQIPLSILMGSIQSINIDKSIRIEDDRNIISIKMTNQFRNPVVLVIESNTMRMDTFLDQLADHLCPCNMMIAIGHSQKLEYAHKLLCSIIIHEQNEEDLS